MEDLQKILVGLGGNLPSEKGQPIHTVKAAISMLSAKGLKKLAISSFYCSKPLPAADQPDFVNCAISAQTSLSAVELLALFKETEKTLGRKAGERWCARTLDIDLLAYGESILPDQSAWQGVAYSIDPAAYLEEPVVPHPRMHKRAFVLLPLMDLAPEWTHPVIGKSVAALAQEPDIIAQVGTVRKISDIS